MCIPRPLPRGHFVQVKVFWNRLGTPEFLLRTFHASFYYVTDKLSWTSWMRRSLVNIPANPNLDKSFQYSYYSYMQGDHNLHLLCAGVGLGSWTIHIVDHHLWHLVLYNTCCGHSQYRPQTWHVLCGYWLLYGLPFFSRSPIDNFTGCYINSKYTVERLMTDYVWVWLTGLVMVVLYSIMAVMMYRLGRGDVNEEDHVAVARKLILYIPHIWSSFMY